MRITITYHVDNVWIAKNMGIVGRKYLRRMRRRSRNVFTAGSGHYLGKPGMWEGPGNRYHARVPGYRRVARSAGEAG
jgi:hypothetical protein